MTKLKLKLIDKKQYVPYDSLDSYGCDSVFSIYTCSRDILKKYYYKSYKSKSYAKNAFIRIATKLNYQSFEITGKDLLVGEKIIITKRHHFVDNDSIIYDEIYEIVKE